MGADGALSVVAQQLFPGRRLRKVPALESEIQFEGMSQEIDRPEDRSMRYSKLAVISLNAAKKGYGVDLP